MRRRLPALLTVCALILAGCAPSATLPPYDGPTQTLLVLPIKGARDLGDALRFGFESAFTNDNDLASRFRVVDRSAVDILVREYTLSASGLIDDQSALQLGKQLNAQVYLGVVVNDASKKSSSYQIGSAKYGYTTVHLYTSSVKLAVKLVDIETGRVLAAATGRAETSSNDDYPDAASVAQEAALDASRNVVQSYIR